MGTSGNPAKKAAQLKISAVGDYKKRLGGIMELPSGLVMKLKNPGGMLAFMSSGMIPNSLMTVIQKSLDNGQPMKAEELTNADGGVDPEFIEQMSELLNNIIVVCSVEPSVEPVPADEADRSDDVLYADEIPDDDKMFVFQWITGGTSDLETFRRKQSEGMADMEAVAGPKSAAKRSVGARKG